MFAEHRLCARTCFPVFNSCSLCSDLHMQQPLLLSKWESWKWAKPVSGRDGTPASHLHPSSLLSWVCELLDSVSKTWIHHTCPHCFLYSLLGFTHPQTCLALRVLVFASAWWEPLFHHPLCGWLFFILVTSCEMSPPLRGYPSLPNLKKAASPPACTSHQRPHL